MCTLSTLARFPQQLSSRKMQHMPTRRLKVGIPRVALLNLFWRALMKGVSVAFDRQPELSKREIHAIRPSGAHDPELRRRRWQRHRRSI